MKPDASASWFDRAEVSAAVLRSMDAQPITLAIVLGSGLADVANQIAEPLEIPYCSIPHFPRPTVAGHEGKAVLGTLGSVRVLLYQGRFHYYEGHDLDSVIFPIRVLSRLGVKHLILTAATGGIRPDLGAGRLVVLTDHLNLLGANPLRGVNEDRFGPRFPDMTEVYSARLRSWAIEEAAALGVELTPGVYACMPGPSYETPAEIRMLGVLGADVVGMSTVPEAIAARHMGMEVLGLALVSNAAAGVTGAPITHEEVLEAGRKAGPMLASLIERLANRIAVLK